jgi:hypothetical protein
MVRRRPYTVETYVRIVDGELSGVGRRCRGGPDPRINPLGVHPSDRPDAEYRAPLGAVYVDPTPEQARGGR